VFQRTHPNGGFPGPFLGSQMSSLDYINNGRAGIGSLLGHLLLMPLCAKFPVHWGVFVFRPFFPQIVRHV